MELRPRCWATQNSSGVEAGLTPWWVDCSFGDVLLREKLFTEINDFTLQLVSRDKGKKPSLCCAGWCTAVGKCSFQKHGKRMDNLKVILGLHLDPNL